MNRLEMAEEIARHIPVLATAEAERCKKAEQLHKSFLKDFPLSKISHLLLDEYVVGKGAHDTFCYRLEREMDCLGRITGAPAFKFGIYFSKKRRGYEATALYGDDIPEAFKELKEDICDLIKAAQNDDLAAIAASPISPMFKGKLLYLYSPEQFAPVYSKRHLEHFVAALNLPGAFKAEWEMQRALMDYRAQFPLLKAQSPILYMRLLYDLFDYPPDDKFSGTTPVDPLPLLNKAVKGAEFIDQMPPLSPLEPAKGRKGGKTDFEKRQKKLKRIGDRGEAIVLELEKDRLKKAGKPKLADDVEHVSQTDDSLGYDILSFEEDGAKRHIEVKATSGKNLDRGFFISLNELEQARTLANYYVYLVFAAMSNQPRILPVKQPAFKGRDFVLQPVIYHVTLPTA